MSVCLYRMSEIDAMRIYKPWLYPEIIFSLYVKLTGQQKILETLIRFPLQVSLLDLNISKNILQSF